MVQPKQTTTEHIESPDEIESVIDDLFDGVSAPAKPKVESPAPIFCAASRSIKKIPRAFSF